MGSWLSKYPEVDVGDLADEYDYIVVGAQFNSTALWSATAYEVQAAVRLDAYWPTG